MRQFQFLVDAGAPVAWGERVCELARIALYELAINAVQHGGCTSLELMSQDAALCLTDNGSAPFGLEALEAGGRGGLAALQALRKYSEGRADISHRWTGTSNEWWLVNEEEGLALSNPCGLIIEGSGRAAVASSVAVNQYRLEGCDEVHVYVPNLFAFSDAYSLYEALSKIFPATRLVCHGLQSDHPLAVAIDGLMPGTRFVP